jgi:acyl-CoA thioesterase
MTTTSIGQVLGSLRPDGDRGFAALLPADWGQGRTIFGGIQVALAVRAMRAAMTGDAGVPLRSVQATFVGPVPPGVGVRLRAEVLRRGRAATQARCDLLHDDGVACAVTAVFGAPRASQLALEIPRPALGVDPEALADLPTVPPLSPVFTAHYQFRWAGGGLPFSGSREPRTAIYVRPREQDCTPEEALVAMADAVPPPALSMVSAPTPASSLCWTLELLGDPAGLARDAWALIGTETRAAADGYLSETSVLWGPTGHAFSVGHQTVAFFG